MLVIKPYLRERAVTYAKKYAFGQNPIFGNFRGIGGNCTNFVSQSIYAGSCVMNYTPTFGWYYVSLDDRSPSWTGVQYFYNFMIEGRRIVEDIPVLSTEYLIPFKMYAWLDLKQRKSNGEFVKEKDFKKHKYDVFRLMNIINESAKIKTQGLVREKVKEFLEKIVEENVPLNSLYNLHTMEESIEILTAIYL